MPGIRLFISDIKVAKPQELGKFNVAGYWRHKYRDKVEDEGWYLLTNARQLTSSDCCIQMSQWDLSDVQRLQDRWL